MRVILTTPIFLHGMWRSGSTYLWSKFRASSKTRCYFEPLIEGLARLTPERIARDTPAVFAANRHPRLGTPYFAEFEPLIAGRGVRQYHSHFATKRFVLGADDRHPALQNYIALLIRHAQLERRAPVLGANRLIMRLPWLTRTFGGFHIQTERDPLDVWASYAERAHSGDSTFFARWLILAERNRHFPPFGVLTPLLPLRRSLASQFSRPKRYYKHALCGLSGEQTYSLTFFAWIAATLQALTWSDLIIDINKAGAPGYAADRAQRVNDTLNLGVDFQDMQAPGRAAAIAPRDYRNLEHALLRDFPLTEYSPYFDRDVCLSRLHELTPRKADLLARLL